MKSILRNYLINLGALWAITQIIPAVTIIGGVKGFMIGALAFMAANIFLIPLLRILLLPLNLLTVGFFTWLSNVLALYFLVTVIPSFNISSYQFPGVFYQGFTIPSLELSTFQTVILVSFLIGLIIHFISWLIK